MDAVRVWKVAELNNRSKELDIIREARFERYVMRLYCSCMRVPHRCTALKPGCDKKAGQMN